MPTTDHNLNTRGAALAGRARPWWGLLVLDALATACSDNGSGTPATKTSPPDTQTVANVVAGDDSDGQAAGPDIEADDAVAPGDVAADTPVDSAEDAVGDLGSDAGPIACPGGAGCPCQQDPDCDSGACIDTPAGKQCAAQCVNGAVTCAVDATGWTLVSSSKLGSASGSITLAGIPAYGYLRIVFKVAQNSGGNQANSIRCNGDSAANYAWMMDYGNGGGGVNSTGLANRTMGRVGTSTANPKFATGWDWRMVCSTSLFSKLRGRAAPCDPRVRLSPPSTPRNANPPRICDLAY